MCNPRYRVTIYEFFGCCHPARRYSSPFLLNCRSVADINARLQHVLLARFNIDKDSHCPRGHLVTRARASRIRDHTFHNCDHCVNYRHILSQVSRDHNPKILLGSVKGLLATSKFLLECGGIHRRRSALRAAPHT